MANLRFFATAILHTGSDLFPTDDRALNYTLRRPRGVAGLISPWNLPLYLFTWKIAPAIATGNTVVAKPSELTPWTAAMLAELCADVGTAAGRAQRRARTRRRGRRGHRRSSGRAADLVHRRHGDRGRRSPERRDPLFKKLPLELGGKNPTVVFADADLDEVMPGIVRSAFENQGEICLCGSRLFVEAPLFDRFVGRVQPSVGRLRVGDPLDEATDQGALVSAAHRDKVESYIALSRELGGEIVTGGGRPAGLPTRVAGGYFLEPTVVTGLPVDCRVNRRRSSDRS